ncbi:UNVERIFIED_CONTAM: hypothetical protein HDU68_007220 [Siphonaria sp. JEL0065]|nr:hypothetical protein HDU68_007220 [Siphonaria sp. JEL0065]
MATGEKNKAPQPSNATTTAESDAHDELHKGFVGATLLFAPLNSAAPSTTTALATPTSQATLHSTATNANANLAAVRIDSVIGSGSFSYVYLAHEHEMLAAATTTSTSADTTATNLAEDALRTLEKRTSNVSSSTVSSSPDQLAPPLQPQRRAVKRLFKEGLDERQLELQRHEVVIMKDLCDHESIVPLLGTVEDKQCLYLIMDYCEMDLYDAITKRGGFSDNAVKRIFAQIVDAVIYCHSKGFYHRDLKPENCLIVSASSAPNDYKIRLTDFGLATADTWSTEMGCGSVRYMPPECFDPNYVSTNPNVKQSKDKKNASNPFSSRNGYPPASSDVWSLGVILVNLLFAKNPWFEAHPTDPIFSTFVASNPNILRQQFNLSPHFDALLRRCFDLDPRRRCSVHDLKALVETMPRFVGGSVPGLIVPLGPGREMAKSGKQKLETSLQLTEEEKIEEINRKYFKDQVPGLVLAPGTEIPAEFDAQQLKLVSPPPRHASRTNSLASSTPTTSSLDRQKKQDGRKDGHDQPQQHQQQLQQQPLPTDAKPASTVHRPHNPMTPYIPSAYSPVLSTANPPSTTQTESTLTRRLSLNLFKPKSSVNSDASIPSIPSPLSPHQEQHQQQQKPPSVAVRFPSLRRRLTKSISGIKKLFTVGAGTAKDNNVSQTFGISELYPSNHSEHQIDGVIGSGTGFFKKGFGGGDDNDDAFFKVGKEWSEEASGDGRKVLRRRGSMNSIGGWVGSRRQKDVVKVIGQRSVLTHSESDPNLRITAASAYSFDSNTNNKWAPPPHPHQRFSSATSSTTISSFGSGDTYQQQSLYQYGSTNVSPVGSGQLQGSGLLGVRPSQHFQQATPPITPERPQTANSGIGRRPGQYQHVSETATKPYLQSNYFTNGPTTTTATTSTTGLIDTNALFHGAVASLSQIQGTATVTASASTTTIKPYVGTPPVSGRTLVSDLETTTGAATKYQRQGHVGVGRYPGVSSAKQA